MDSQELKQFDLFIGEIKKYDFIDGFMAQTILSRFIQPLRKRVFFNENLKLKYYQSYWFKIAVSRGVLETRGFGYKVIKDKIPLKNMLIWDNGLKCMFCLKETEKDNLNVYEDKLICMECYGKKMS